MARRRISQRDARAAIARVRVLEEQENLRRVTWRTEWPGGVHLGDITWASCMLICEAAVTARKLGHAVVALPDSNRQRMSLFALPLSPKE